MKDFVVFYAWQSDRPTEITRALIREALETAASAITNDASVSTRVLIDSDTQGVLGHVPVIDTIIEKIRATDAFVPDLTFVAVTDDGKHIPNPNVLLEYGYALAVKTHSIMIPVMNIEYGLPENLPFDFGYRRHPLTFKLSPTATAPQRLKAIKKLSENFEEILRLMIAAAPAKGNVENLLLEAKPAREPAFYFPPNKQLASVGFPDDKQEYQFDGNKAIYLRLFPKTVDGQPRIGRAGLKDVFYHRRVPRPMAYPGGQLSAANDYGWITFDPASQTTTKAITQGFVTGELWGVCAQPFVSTVYNRYVAAPEQIIALAVISAEKIYERALENYLSVAVQEFKLQPPFIIELGASALKGVYMAAPHPESSSGHYYGPIRDETLVRRYELTNTATRFAESILRQYFDELYDLAECSRDAVLDDDFVNQQGLIPRNSD